MNRMKKDFEERVARLLKEHYKDKVEYIKFGEGVYSLFEDHEAMSDAELLHEILKIVDVKYEEEAEERDPEEEHFEWFQRYRS